MGSAELKDLVLKHVQNEKEAHFRIRLEKQNEGQAPVGDPTKEGRSDRLIDLCLYFISPQNFTQADADFIAELSKEVWPLGSLSGLDMDPCMGIW